jgi:hypothetical protein
MTVLRIINSFPNCLMQLRQVRFVINPGSRFCSYNVTPPPKKKIICSASRDLLPSALFCLFSSVTFYPFAFHFPFLSVLFYSFSFTFCPVSLFFFYNFPHKAPPYRRLIFGIVCVLIWSPLYNRGSKSSAFESLQFETDVHCYSLDVLSGLQLAARKQCVTWTFIKDRDLTLEWDEKLYSWKSLR